VSQKLYCRDIARRQAIPHPGRVTTVIGGKSAQQAQIFVSLATQHRQSLRKIQARQGSQVGG